VPTERGLNGIVRKEYLNNHRGLWVLKRERKCDIKEGQELKRNGEKEDRLSESGNPGLG